MTPENEAKLGQLSERLAEIHEALRILQKEEKTLIEQRDVILYDGWSRTHASADWISLATPNGAWSLDAARYSCKTTLWRRTADGYSTEAAQTTFSEIGTDEQLGQAAVAWAKEQISKLPPSQVNLVSRTFMGAS